MSLDIQKYLRKPFPVEAVRLDTDNFNLVSDWANALIIRGRDEEEDQTQDTYLKIDVIRPLNEKQTEARIGDWVVKTETGFKIYRHSAFLNTFSEHPQTRLNRSNEKLVDQIVLGLES